MLTTFSIVEALMRMKKESSTMIACPSLLPQFSGGEWAWAAVLLSSENSMVCRYVGYLMKLCARPMK